MVSKKFIPLSVPNICGNELKYITEAVESQWVSTAGESIIKLEKKFSAYLNVDQTCACQSGTAGLHLCLHHFGIGQHDIVLVPTLTFIASINSIMYQKAIPVFFDCNDNLCINVNQIIEYIENECNFDGKKLIEKESAKQVKAILAVHIFGDMCDMEVIMDIAKKYNLIVIEDATESLGTVITTGKYRGMKSGTVGHAGVFSFNGNKIITTGGGGLVVSNDKSAIDHIRYLSQQAKDDPINFIHNEMGFNYRMTNIQAALGLGQLELLDKFISIKRENYDYYVELLENNKLGKLLPFKETGSNKWFYTFVLNREHESKRDEVIKFLSENNIQVRPIWKLNHLQKPFIGYKAMDTVKAMKYYNSVINLPCSTNLTKNDIEIVCNVLNSFTN